MGTTYTQLYFQLVFAVKFRAALIEKSWKDELEKYITGITQDNKHKMLQTNCQPDHVHILTGFHPNQSISSFVQNVKAESTKWIKSKRFCKSSFAWQDNFGAFSYCKSDVINVISYIQNQSAHHKKITFLDEYKKLLNDFQIEYDERYLFTEPI